MERKNSIYNDNSYISNNPNLHTEDSDFKFIQFKEMLESVQIGNNRIKILDVGGGAGLLGKSVMDYFLSKGYEVEMNALDLSSEMLLIQAKNNKAIKNRWNCTLEECPDSDFDLVLMIDVIEHIPNKELASKKLNQISRFVIFNIPIELNAFDYCRNIFNKFQYYNEQKRILGHLHFFSIKSGISFLIKNFNIVDYKFQPYCFLIKESDYDGYKLLRKSKLRMFENYVSCWISKYFRILSPWLIQGSLYSIVKTK